MPQELLQQQSNKDLAAVVNHLQKMEFQDSRNINETLYQWHLISI